MQVINYRIKEGISFVRFNAALKSYVKRKDKDLNRLMFYAKTFRLEKIIKQYMEILL